MCNDCCRQFKGWGKSFTRTEALLGALEAVLLTVCVAFLIFLILHLAVCSPRTKTVQEISTHSYENETLGPNADNYTEEAPTQSVDDTTLVTVQCTWEPSKKTPASTHYYDPDNSYTTQIMSANTTEEIAVMSPASDIDDVALGEEMDGEDAEEAYGSLVVALVKLKPHGETTFGCILTAVSLRWTLTAASCLESIDFDSSPSFVMMQGYSSHGRTHAVVDVSVHPSRGGGDGGHDLAALRAAGRLGGAVAELPTMLDYLLVTIGEQFTLLGFGGFRSGLGSRSARRLRRVLVYTLPPRRCAPAAAARAAPLCAGVLPARGAPCPPRGAPLLRGAALLGVGSGARRGRACGPALYANVARVRGWVEDVIGDQ